MMQKESLFTRFMGIITEVHCPFCGGTIPKENQIEYSKQHPEITVYACPKCRHRSMRAKSHERIEFDKHMKETCEDPILQVNMVTPEDLTRAMNLVKHFRCKLGWNPKFCQKWDCMQAEECRLYQEAEMLVKKVEIGWVKVTSEERAWQL
jgi:ssDNA-binding Zn-finger/Zn-ribbon topoisomerase 1